MTYMLRPAHSNDYAVLLNFLNGANQLHRHLDWRDSLDWLSHTPFFLLEDDRRIVSLLACPPDPPEVAWVRLFGVSLQLSPDRAWKQLFEPALAALRESPGRPALASLALRDWFGELLLRNGFRFYQEIVVFHYDQAPPPAPTLEAGLVLRSMTPEDLAQVGEIDHLAFEPIWRLSEQDLHQAYRKSAYMTVVEWQGQIIAYQMSSSNAFYAHLARLAVRPDMQHRKIGYALVQNLLDHFLVRKNSWAVTLNTQHNNTSSIALYQKIGFTETGERFPVYLYAA